MEFPMSMPGSFLPDHDSPAQPTLTRASATSALYLPPASPSASSSLSRSIRAIPRITSGSGEGSRKRPRLDTTSSVIDTSWGRSQDESRTSFSSVFSSAPSPSPLINSTYRIAGGLDTPTAAYAQYNDQHYEEEQDYRHNRFASRPQRDYFPQTPSPLDRDGNGRKRAHSAPGRHGWGKTVWSLTGGVAGKVFNFCTSAFRGFQAGGGQSYQLDESTPSMVEHTDLSEVEDRNDVFNREYRGSTPVPGHFPQGTFIEDYMSHPQSYQEGLSTPTQKYYAKRGSSLRENWHMVVDSDLQSRETSPVRKKPRPSSAPFELHRPVSRASIAARPRLGHAITSVSNASFASPRGNGLIQRHSHSRTSTSEAPSHGHRRSRSSIASPRRLELPEEDGPRTPVSPEVKQFQKKVKRREKIHDESLRRLTEQTSDLIRIGKEALGTRIEVQEDSEIDEGYGEGTEELGDTKWWT